MKYKLKKQYRLKEWDYTGDGYYFVTICTKKRKSYLGNIINAKVKLSSIGKIVKKFWLEIPNHFNNVRLDYFVIMPNHLHGIIFILNDSQLRRNAPWRVLGEKKLINENAPRRVPTKKFGPLQKNSLASIINHFKGKVKRYCNKNNLGYFAWQSRFYDRVLRNEKELNGAREYIDYNPDKWEWDRNNLEGLYM